MKRLVEWRVRKSKRRKGTLSLEKSSLNTVSLKKPLWKQTVLIGNPIFGEIILGYSIFEETSLKTNGSHWKPYLWRNHPWIRYLWRNLFENKRFSLETLSLEKASLKSGIPLQHQNKGTASRDSSHDAPLSTLWGTGGAARAAVPAYFPSASEYAYRQMCSPPRVLPHSRCR